MIRAESPVYPTLPPHLLTPQLLKEKADFTSKLNISLKEASETSYWIVILSRTGYLDDKIYSSLKKDVDEIIRIIIASLKTTRKNEKYIS